ncbi:hypothetical protein DNTS_033747 [Danionella cerebrum]|uniref:Uncharacterized protein n=1 Tax=Danionella cerebrum TaxID=2873325 RepID=A0A553RDF3_9TELE|nr:hypothetical protein DNTS_033747 [Danionella translucida]
MELWKLSPAMMLSIAALACSAEGLSVTLNRDHWASDEWQEPLQETLSSEVAGLLKRSKSHQFYGLMGKRSETQYVPTTRIQESSTVLNKPNKHTDLQSDWDQLQYY